MEERASVNCESEITKPDRLAGVTDQNLLYTIRIANNYDNRTNDGKSKFCQYLNNNSKKNKTPKKRVIIAISFLFLN